MTLILQNINFTGKENVPLTLEWHFPHAVRGDKHCWILWPGKQTLFCLRADLFVSDKQLLPDYRGELTAGDILLKKSIQSLMAYANLKSPSDILRTCIDTPLTTQSNRGALPWYKGVYLIHPEPDLFTLIWEDRNSSGIQNSITMNKSHITDWYARQPLEMQSLGDILTTVPMW